MRLALIPLASLALAACTTVPDDPVEREVGATGGQCEAGDTAQFTGQRATAEIGARIQRVTGASSLRWGPPGAVFTMDYRQDRVNVMYDQDMLITEVRCG